MLKLFIPSMQAQQTPCVVTNTSSYGGLLNPSYQGFGSGVAYVASKHSVTIVTEALEHQLRTTEGNQVTVHGLFPGEPSPRLPPSCGRRQTEASAAATSHGRDGLQGQRAG
eukprot:COSAG04_NODE_5381_length_1636_cov_1.566688_2_plen_111_part_00